MIKIFFLAILAFLSMCCDSKVVLIEHTPPPPKLVPTTMPSEKLVFCFAKDMEWAKPIAYIAASERFSRFVIIIAKENTDNGSWILYGDEHESPIDEVISYAKIHFKNHDIIFFVDNTDNFTPKTAENIWYFTGKVWLDDKLNQTIWDVHHD